VTVDAEGFFFLHDLITSYVKEKEKLVSSGINEFQPVGIMSLYIVTLYGTKALETLKSSCLFFVNTVSNVRFQPL